jgi:hypothetical protein
VKLGRPSTLGKYQEDVQDDGANTLHQAGVKRYWTTPGDGVAPDPTMDIVGGHIVVQVEPGSTNFKVTYKDGARTDTYVGATTGVSAQTFAEAPVKPQEASSP